MYRTISLITLLTLLLSACLPQPTTSPQPTEPPYTPLPPKTMAAVVVQRTPERGEELPPDGTIELVFDRAMDKASVENAFRLSPSLPGVFHWADERTLHFKPSVPLKRDRDYRVTVGAEAQAADGNHLAGEYRFRFHTVGFLKVAQVLPAPGTADVATDATITVIFNRPVVPLTAVSDPSYSDLPQPVTFEPEIAGRGEWLNTSIYIFTPAEPLAGGTTYTARVAAGLTDTTGGLLAEDYTWSFSTIPPQVTWVTPDEEADLVPVDTSVRVTFNMAVECASAAGAFDMQTGLVSVPGTFLCLGDTLIFTPTERLQFDTSYHIHIEAGVRSTGGGDGMPTDYDWGFHTVPLPRIISTDPADGEEAPSYVSFQITFNAPIDPATVLPNLTMNPPISRTQVSTYFRTWNNTFVLNFGAQPSSEYEVHIGPDIADPYGNTIGQEMTVRFRTRPLNPNAWLAIPNGGGLYDAHRPARVLLGHINVPQATLSLYRLEWDEFSVLQRDPEYQPRNSPLRTWDVNLESPQDRKVYTPIDLVGGGGLLAPGLYLLDLRAAGVNWRPWVHRRLLAVSDYNLTLKIYNAHGTAHAPMEAWVWATALATGDPVPGLQLTAYDKGGNPLGSATTDEQGLAHIVPDRPYTGDWYIASSDPFAMVADLWNWGAGLRPWDFGLPSGYGEQAHRVHLYTDRPIYRPGQTVYFRGIVRLDRDARYDLPTGEKAFLTIEAPDGEEIYREAHLPDGFGNFDGQLRLAEGAALGKYSLKGEIGDDTFRAEFTVAAYRPPEFEVRVTPETDEIMAYHPTQATVSVRYFSGGPVTGIKVEWHVLSSPYHFHPARFGRYRFDDRDAPWGYCWFCLPPTPDEIAAGTATTDPAGQFTIPLPTDILTGGQRLIVEALAYGKDGQGIAGRGEIIVHRGDFYIGLAPQKYVFRAGDRVAVDVVTVDWDGERVPHKDLNITIARREWHNTFVKDESGGHWEAQTVDTVVYTGTLTTDAIAEGTVTFTPQEGGSYRIVAAATDGSARSSTFVWVSSSTYVSWRRDNSDRFSIIGDKTTYRPGETAEILIPSPFTGEQWAWITVERGGLLRQEVIHLENNSTIYRLPITADDAPNIFVSVILFRGPDDTDPLPAHRVGYLMLEVLPVEQQLQVTITPSVPQAEPGATVSFDIETRNAAGKPISATLSFDLVDKAILTLKPRPKDGILAAFYGQRDLAVWTYSGMSIFVNRLVEEQLQALEDQVLMMGIGGGGGGEVEWVGEGNGLVAESAPLLRSKAGDGETTAPTVRERFADTALWDAAVTTDEAGHATVTVTLPDNLTTWVARAVAATARTQVGESTLDFPVTKPLLVRPIAPRFFVVGDRAQLAVLVGNHTGAEQEATVTLHADGLLLADPATRQVTIPDGDEAKVTWWVTATDVPTVSLIFSAVAGDYADAARPRLTTGPGGTLLVRRYIAPEVVGTGGQLIGEDSRTEVIAMPPRYDGRQGALSVRLDPSPAAGMTTALDYLEEFPYECVEQVVSRLLPNVVTYRALKRLGLSNPELEEKLPALITAELRKLSTFQNPDGGWGWWDGEESTPYLTAYALLGLTTAREADFPVDAAVIGRAQDYLIDNLLPARQLTSARQANRQAFLLYVLAESGRTRHTSETGELFRHRDKLSHYGKALLALTLSMTNPDDSRIATLLSDLQNAAIFSATGAHWEENEYDYWAMNTDTRSTAIILDTLARLDQDNPLIPNIVRWLMIARRGGIWETTQETAWAVVAFTDWMVVTGELRGEYEYEVGLNDTLLTAGRVTPDNVAEPVTIQVSPADLPADLGNRLTIGRGPGPGRLYYTAHLRVYLPAAELEPLNRGIIVTRQYYRPGSDRQPLDGAVRVGDEVKVGLTIIAPHDLYYVIVEDPLPAGAEPVDTALATTSLLEQGADLTRKSEPTFLFYRRWWQWYSHSEMRDDRVVLFADYLPAGTYEYTYTFRATLPGRYQVIPTTAQEMYFPEVFGRGTGQTLTIE